MERRGFPAFVEEVRQRRRPWVASFRPLVTGILRYCGALVAPAETAAAALAITETLRPDVIIVDFSFPTDSGVAVVRFDPKTEKFQSWTIPGGGDIVRNTSVTKDGNFVLANSLVNAVTLVTIGK